MIGGTMETDILGGLQMATERYWFTIDQPNQKI